LRKCIDDIKIKFANIKTKVTKTEEEENKKQKKIKWMEDYIQSINKRIQLIKNEIEN
jgi:cob(I)alamin adenosyltransferase